MELAVLLWTKAISADTYATWVLHLWGMLSGQHTLPSLILPDGDAEKAGLWTGCGRDFVGSGKSQDKGSRITSSGLETMPIDAAVDAGLQYRPQVHTRTSPAIAATESARTVRIEKLTAKDETQSRVSTDSALERHSSKIEFQNAASPPIAIGLQRDPNILSEKNLLLIAHKVPATNRWTSAGKAFTPPDCNLQDPYVSTPSSSSIYSLMSCMLNRAQAPPQGCGVTVRFHTR